MSQNITMFAKVDLQVGSYRGHLTPRDVGRGVLATRRNARRLFNDALILLKNGRYPGAISLKASKRQAAASR